MSIYKKIIPCLDVKGGLVVKGIEFVDFKVAGDPVEMAKKYVKDGADELVFLDISATVEERKTTLQLVQKVAEQVTVPLCVGGGISEIGDIEKVFKAGAKKASIGTAGVKNPEFIRQAIKKYGERIVIAMDAKKIMKDCYNVFINGGSTDTNIDVRDWSRQLKDMGVSEILLTSIDEDGKKNGYDIPLIKMVKEISSAKITASGGAGKLEHFKEAFTLADADGALAASLFHFKLLTVSKVKNYLKAYNIKFISDLEKNDFSYLFAKSNLIPAIIQDYYSNEVLMLGYCNQESLKLTLESGLMHFYSRSRKKLWKKGETSGNTLKVKRITVDCDNDTLLVSAIPAGPVCHTGNATCFNTILEVK